MNDCVVNVKNKNSYAKVVKNKIETLKILEELNKLFLNRLIQRPHLVNQVIQIYKDHPV